MATVTAGAPYNAGGTSAVNHLVPMPSSVAGDVLVLFCNTRNATADTLQASGWTRLYAVTGTQQRNFAVMVKVAGASEPSSVDLTSADGLFSLIAHPYKISGVSNVIGDFDWAEEGGNGFGGNDYDPPSLTATSGNKEYAWLCATVAPADGGFVSGPAGYTSLLTANDSNPAELMALGSAYRVLTAETEDPSAFTISTGTPPSEMFTMAIPSAVASTPTFRKSSTFDIETTLGTITTATLNSVNVFDHVTGQVGTTVSFAGAATDEITTSGEYDLVLGDGTGTETITVQVNVYGVAPSNNPLQKDGSALASLSNVEVRVTAGSNLDGAQLEYLPTATTDASGNLGNIDLSSTAAADTDPILLHMRTAAGDSIIASETVGLI